MEQSKIDWFVANNAGKLKDDKMEFSIYKVESNANYLYLYSYELNSPVKIKIQGSSLYTMNGDRYEIWR